MRCRVRERLKVDTHAKSVIKKTLEFLSRTINLSCEITEFPDEIKRNSPACDALAIMGTKNVAVEHTSIDSIPLQRRDDARFKKLLGPLEDELAGKLPVPGYYRLVIEMNAIPTGINWDNVRQRIWEWCQKVAPTLEIGGPFTTPRHFIRETPRGAPFEVTLYRWPKRDGQFKVTRFAPEDLENQRTEVIYRALASRGTKVARYRNGEFRTILILESEDIALANDSDIGQAFVNAIKKCGSTPLPDEVYLVQTEVKPYDFYCLKFGDALFPNAPILKEPYVIQRNIR